MVDEKDGQERQDVNESSETEATESPTPSPEYEPVEAAEETAPVLNPVSRLIAVITDPVGAMKGVREKGGWVIPMIVILVGIGLFFVIAGDVVTDFAKDKMREQFTQMVEQGRMSQEQADTIYARQTSGNTMAIFMMINPIIATFLMKLIMAALMILGGNIIFGGSARFGRYWSMMWYAGVIGAIGMVVSAILINVTGDMQGAQLGLGILTKSDPTSTAHKIAQAFGVFSIWEGIVAGIGVSVLANTSRGKGIAFGLFVYIGLALITSLLAGQPMV